MTMVGETIDATGAIEAHAEWKGTTRYEIVRRIGTGGMGAVYEAFDRDRRQRVALKTLLRFSPASLYRFKQEFRTLADVHHPNLVHLYELVVSETDPVFFTMELVPGTDFLTHVLRVAVARTSDLPTESGKARAPSRRSATPAPFATIHQARLGETTAHVERLCAALIQLVEGVQALHAAGKLHRDIKPSNVQVGPTGRVVLLDFGVATEVSRIPDEAASDNPIIVGTPRYMAPEQGVGEPPTAACDWYSVGVMLYEALVGRPPFNGSAIDVLAMKSTLDPIAPSECVQGVPPELDALCCALLSRDARERPTGPEILRRLGAKSSPMPVAASSEVRIALVGRERHLRSLRDAFDATRRGHSITVRIPGASGLGKSTLVHHFVDELEENVEAEVLRGRAYERESVPYKAVDAVIDALSRYMQRLIDQGTSIVMPPDAWALARLFPVLRSVPGIALLSEEPSADPQALRQRAFVALRDLFAQIARRHPLVVFIDDVQWGDSDSAALLLELMRPPHSPPLLLLMTYREEDEDTNAFLHETSAQWPAGAEVRQQPVGPLDEEEARHLALALLGANGDPVPAVAEAVARESGGSPFLVEELARGAGDDLRSGAVNDAGASSPPGAGAAQLTLDQLIRTRLARLSAEARALVEVVAVAGRPLPIPILRDASGGAGVDDAIGLLRTERFVRSGFRDGCEVIEPTHDRIRETIVTSLSNAVLRERHGQLARALEAMPGADLEALSVHLLGAGDKDGAARYAEQAAEQAVSKLAFDQAVRLFRVTLRIIDPNSPAMRRLSARLASLLEWSGRGGEAALVYLDAAKGAPAGERIELERAAAEQLLACGRIDEGAQVLRGVLASMGIRIPRTALGALLLLLLHRVWLRVVGVGFRDRSPEDVSREDRVRVDALYSIGLGLSIVNVVLGACMQSRHLIVALEVGDREQILRAASLEAAQLAGEGGTPSAHERAVADIAGTLAERVGEAEGDTFFQGSRAVGLFLRGHWRDAHRFLDRSYERSPHHRAGWHANAKLFAVYALYYMGELRAQAQRARQLLADAEQRNDLYIVVNLRTTSMVDIALCDDDPETARTHLREAMDQWSQDGFHVQHWKAMVWGAETELYAGDAARAVAILHSQARALSRSLLLNVQYLRATTAFVRARAFIALATSTPDRRRRLIAKARRIARQLEGEQMPYTEVLASFVAAAAANAAGDREAALGALERAIHRANLADMSMHASVARQRFGLLLGGAAGGRRVRDAETALGAQDIRIPDRYAAMLLPGRWEPKG
jgi:serine/threonine protein kinase